jgi:hypothetical protein
VVQPAPPFNFTVDELEVGRLWWRMLPLRSFGVCSWKQTRTALLGASSFYQTRGGPVVEFGKYLP